MQEKLTGNWCVDEPWRLIQTNLREIDMEQIAVGEFIKNLEDFQATVLMVNAAGIIANYDTNLEFHTRNPYLCDDSLKQLLGRCHERRIRVIARTDFSKIRPRVFAMHPEWAYRTVDGQVMNYNDNIQACLNGGYQQDYVFRILKELFDTFSFDGIYSNMGGFHTVDYSYREYGICHCENCKMRFREAFHMELPFSDRDSSYGAYRRFKDLCVKDYQIRVKQFLHDINPDIAVDLYDFQRSESGTELNNAERTWLYGASSNTRSVGPKSRMRASNADVDFLGYPYRHVSVAPAVHRIRLLQSLANLGGLDYYMIGDFESHRDHTAYPDVKEIFGFAKEQEEFFKGLETAAKVLVVRKALWADDPEERGFIRLLSELHIPFAECILSGFPGLQVLNAFAVVILPDVEFISDVVAETVDQFVELGGILLATGRTGMGNERYEARIEPALNCLGIESVRYVKQDAVSTMLQKSEGDEVFEHVTAPYTATGELYVLADMKKQALGFFRMIPPHMFGPPEKCYFDEVSSVPGISRYAYKQGVGIYIPWQPGRFFYQEGHLNTKNLMEDVICILCGQKSIAPELTPMVETNLVRGRGRQIVFLINLSGSFFNSLYPPVRIQQIKLEIPSENPSVEVKTLVSKEVLPYTRVGSILYVTLPYLDEFEGVVVSEQWMTC